MKKTTIILLCIAAVVCMVLVGFTGYYIGSKSHKQDTTQVATNPLEETTEVATTDVEAIKAELREEVKEEVRKELYDEIYNQAMADVEASLDEKLAELDAEQQAAEEEAAKEAEEASKNTETQTQQTTTKPSNNGGNTNNNSGGKTESPKTTPYIKVHDVSASMSGGNDAIEAALKSAVDASSGTVMCDPSAITGLGTFPVYWTSTDGATATSYITITE